MIDHLLKAKDFSPPDNWMSFETIDMHTGGEPLRVVLSGYGSLKGKSVLENRRYLKEHLDVNRRVLMLEPRGHSDMYGCILVAPNDDGADFGIVFMHNEGYSTMCGHAILAITKLATQLEWKPIVEGINEWIIDAPYFSQNHPPDGPSSSEASPPRPRQPDDTLTH